VIICIIRDVLPKPYNKFVPSPMAMGLPFYIGAASVSAFRMFLMVVMHASLLRQQQQCAMACQKTAAQETHICRTADSDAAVQMQVWKYMGMTGSMLKALLHR
jgi:hypothetical protein